MAFDYQQERLEAIAAGNRALESLLNAREQLYDAESWGFVDILGGGLFSTMVKHAKMDDAHEYMKEARDGLQSFSKELRDISSQIDLDFNCADFLSFADYFFDGIIADCLIQERINEAKEQVDEAIEKVKEVLSSL